MKYLFVIPGLFLFVACAGKPVSSAVSASDTAGPTEKSATAPTTKVEGAPEKSGREQIVCTRGKERRVLSVKSGETAKCEVLYEKGAQNRVIASAHHDEAYCDKVVSKTMSHLTQDGFKCDE